MIHDEASKDGAHPLFMAIWLDREQKWSVFDQPAPIWQSCTAAEREQYWVKHQKKFVQVADLHYEVICKISCSSIFP